jgi:hypothetical protein
METVIAHTWLQTGTTTAIRMMIARDGDTPKGTMLTRMNVERI